MRYTYFFRLGMFLLFLAYSCKGTSQTKLSPEATISFYTCAPGEELYSVFGHSALRIHDPANRIDQVFNWGIFDFDTPNFYLKFIRGQLPYKLGTQVPKNFLREYRYYKRPVTEHTLLLAPDEKQKIFDLVFENYKPENRYYPYDFFYDNCASRIVDIIDASLAGKLNWGAQQKPTQSFRDLLDPYLDHLPWADLGIDLILGLHSDKIASYRQQMFLPDYIPANLAKMRIDRDSTQALVIGDPIDTLSYPVVHPDIPWWKKPAPLFWLLCILVALGTYFLPATHFFHKLDLLWFGAAGLAGALFLFMWLGTDHEACYRNMNMLWANPLYLLALPALWNRPIKQWERILLLAFGLLNVCVILGFKWLPQDLNVAVVPLAMMLLVRIVFRVWGR